ncbi:MAG: polyprenyl synthetase family protein [Pseudomonadota bacterium]
MGFNARLGEVAEATERHLTALMADAGPAPGRLAEAMRYAVLGGGKRLRPFLVVESAKLFDVPPETALRVGAALECIHCYSLVHDDLPAMDNDELRRGRPTVWKAYDDWTAILSGDGLLTLAFEALTAPGLNISDAQRVALIAGLAKASGWQGMVGGQVVDLMSDKLGDPPEPDFAHVQQLQSMKTGALILYAAEAGAILGEATADERLALTTYGTAIGFAFQIADDLLDKEGDAARMGKAARKDSAAGKATLVDLLGVDEARAALNEALSAAHDALAPFGAGAATLKAAADFIAKRDH